MDAVVSRRRRDGSSSSFGEANATVVSVAIRMYGSHTSGKSMWRRAAVSSGTTANVTRRSSPTPWCSSPARPLGKATGRVDSAPSGCTNRTHRGRRRWRSAALSSGTSANVRRRSSPTTSCSSRARPTREWRRRAPVTAPRLRQRRKSGVAVLGRRRALLCGTWECSDYFVKTAAGWGDRRGDGRSISGRVGHVVRLNDDCCDRAHGQSAETSPDRRSQFRLEGLVWTVHVAVGGRGRPLRSIRPPAAPATRPARREPRPSQSSRLVFAPTLTAALT